MRGQSGFTITNIIVIIALIAGSIFGWKHYEHKKERQATLKLMELSAVKIRDHLQKLLKHDSAWKHTVQARENAGMACLRERTSCTGKGGLIAVRDPLNRAAFDSSNLVNGFSHEGSLCSWFSETERDDCPFRMEVRWAPLCHGDCVAPETVTITAKMLFRPGVAHNVPLNDASYGFSFSREALPSDPRSCLQLLLSGQTQDAIYAIRPDPNGASLSVYCDQNRDGGGWALIVNSAKPELGELPIDHTISPSSHARMPAERIKAIFNASEKQNENNIRLLLPEVDGGLVLSASSNGSVEAADYKAAMPNGDCRKILETPSYASSTASSYFSLDLSGKGSAGFSHRNDPAAGFIGFYACFGSTLSGNACGNGCERKWKGSLVRQAGSIWIR